MGPITASPVAFDLELAGLIDIEITQPIPSKAPDLDARKPTLQIVDGEFNTLIQIISATVGSSQASFTNQASFAALDASSISQKSGNPSLCGYCRCI
jgi:hypothetical protein